MRTRSSSKTATATSIVSKRKYSDPDDTSDELKVKVKRKAPQKPSSTTRKTGSKEAPKSRKDEKVEKTNGIDKGSAEDHSTSSPPSTQKLSEKKFAAWSQHAKSSPYPDFVRPTRDECQVAYDILEELHGDVIREVFADPDAPAQEYPYVMDALVVAALSQATSWNNAKRAMKNMKAIVEGGMEKLVDALRPGGMQNRKAKILMQLLNDIRDRHGKWDLQHLFNASDEDVVKEVVSYWGLGPKCAFCLMSICLNRDAFAVDTHIHRITGLWGWRPRDASKELAQAHLDARIPNELKFGLHYQFIVHGQKCPVCRGNGDSNAVCVYRTALREREGVNGGSGRKR
ncbi:hypothetical protein SGCOL_004917 [Colletotrichum sp. CLE4]